jgi:hypothetical protein
MNVSDLLSVSVNAGSKWFALHGGECVDVDFLGSAGMWTCTEKQTFWRSILSPSSGFKVR